MTACYDGTCPIETKPVHGEAVPLWKKLGLKECAPVDSPYSIGDSVVYTNSYGAEFRAFVIGFADACDMLHGGYIHLSGSMEKVVGWAWWYPHEESEISK